MANNPKHMLKPEAPAHKPTKEEQAQQIARFFSQKREQYFSIILGTAIRSANIIPVRQGFKGEDFAEVVEYDLRPLIDASIVAADYAVEKLYPLPAEPKQEEAK